MCPNSGYCPLCLSFGTEFKELVDEYGQHNNIYEIAAQYFDTMLLTTFICSKCWQQIYEFHEFQQTVLKAHNDLENVGNNEQIIKLEMMVVDEEDKNEVLEENINTPISNAIDLKDYNPFESEDEIPLVEYSTKKIRELEKLRIKDTKEYIKKINNTSSVENSKEDKEIIEENATFSCIFCDEKFKHAKELRKHTIIHTGKDTYECPFCDTKFHGKQNISRHVKNLHPTDYAGFNIRKLKSLQEVALNSNVLKKEIFEKKSEKARKNQLCATSDKKETAEIDPQNQSKFICNICGKKFKSACKLREHIKYIHNKEANSVQCPHCPIKISLPRNLPRHIKALHPDKYVEPEKKDEPKVDLNLIGRDINSTEEHTPNYDDYDGFIAKWKPELECPLCKSVSSNLGLLKEHFMREHPNKVCHVKCCGYILRKRLRLVEHIRFHLDPKSFECEICGRCAIDSPSLKMHMRIHSEEKPFQCQICKKAFRLKHKLLDHAGTHSTEINEFCKICNRGFSNKYLVKKHVFNAHKEYKVRHLCEQCGKCFYNEIVLKRHLLEHAGAYAVVEKTKWPCNQCGAQLKARSTLASHIKAFHSDSRAEFVCGECHKKFLSKSGLYLHMKTIHYGEYKPKRKVKCPVCDKELASTVSLRAHKARHNGSFRHQCPHCPLFLKHKKNIRRHVQLMHPSEFAQMNQLKISKVDFSLLEESIDI